MHAPAYGLGRDGCGLSVSWKATPSGTHPHHIVGAVQPADFGFRFPGVEDGRRAVTRPGSVSAAEAEQSAFVKHVSLASQTLQIAIAVREPTAASLLIMWAESCCIGWQRCSCHASSGGVGDPQPVGYGWFAARHLPEPAAAAQRQIRVQLALQSSHITQCLPNQTAFPPLGSSCYYQPGRTAGGANSNSVRLEHQHAQRRR